MKTQVKRITRSCETDTHNDCNGGFHQMLVYAGLKNAKQSCCLCTCHSYNKYELEMMGVK